MRNILLGLGILLIVGCTNELTTSNEEIINLDLSIEQMSRASSIDGMDKSSFVEGDEVGLFFKRGNKAEVLKKYTIGATKLKWNEVVPPPYEESEKVNIFGFYPFVEVTDSKAYTFDVTVGNPDLLVAIPKTVKISSTDKIDMVFKHSMSRIKVSYISSDKSVSEDELNAIETVCNANSKCNVNIEEGNIDSKSVSGYKSFKKITGNNATIIVVPQKSSENEIVTLNMNICGTTFYHKITKELESGKQLNVNIDCKRSDTGDIGIEFSRWDINGWEDGGTVSDEIDLDNNK